jgi:glycosyltransferase involved in cell wall biosynthesis
LNTKPSISVIILTYNEEQHIARCIKSVQQFSKRIFIVDSFSTDATMNISRTMGAECFQHKWENNHALQFNWALEHLPLDTEWIMRLDADEYVLPELAREIHERLFSIRGEVSGININRRVIFMDRWIRRGGYYPTTLLRIWRRGAGMFEQRWMDEHVKLEWGDTLRFKFDLVDHNLNNLTWWTAKHNNYATREAMDFLMRKFGFTDDSQNIGTEITSTQDKRKRWFKENVYFKIPLFIRPFFYFIYRYIFKLGFLDGKQGLIWHFLQGFWYRFLVDAKVYEVYRNTGREKSNVKTFLEKEIGTKL